MAGSEGVPELENQEIATSLPLLAMTERVIAIMEGDA